MMKSINGAYRGVGIKNVLLRCLMIGFFFFVARSVSVADTPELNLTDNPEPNTSETFVSITLTIDPNILTKGDTYYKAVDVCGEKARPVEVVGPVAENSEGLCMPITDTCPIKVLQIKDIKLLKPDLNFQVTYDPPGDWNNNEPPKGDFKFFARCLPILSEDLRNIDAEFIVTPPQKTVFVTSETYTGNLGGPAGADAKCNNLAQEAGLYGIFKAWIYSSLVIPSEGGWTYSKYPYVRVDGVTIAESFSDIVDCAPSCLKAKINVDENGNTLISPPLWAWVGATEGDYDWNDRISSCNFWSSAEEEIPFSSRRARLKGSLGSLTHINREWLNSGNHQKCNLQAHLYCFQQ